MYSLPPYHVPRHRLTGLCAGYKVVVVEAGAGYGKSVLGAELVTDWCAVGVEVQLDHPGTDANLLVGRFRPPYYRRVFLMPPPRRWPPAGTPPVRSTLC